MEKLADKLTGIKEYNYDFHSTTLPYDLERDKKFRNFYAFNELKGSFEEIISELEELNRIRLAVSERYANSFKAINEEEDLQNKSAFINLIFNDGFKGVYDQQKFIKALLNPVDEAIRSYKSVKNKLENTEDIFANKDSYRDKLISELQILMLNQQEPYLSANKKLSGFYGKRTLSASEGFHLAYQANRRDPLKPKVIKNMIASMQPIGENTHLDIHIRPPDCGVFITPEDIKRFQEAKIKVNITIHEYKQNYTRRYLQQYTHDLMRQANSVQFFNETDRDNAIIAATYGDCDKRNTTESTGIAKKIREVGEDYILNKYPVKKYDLKRKSGLTVASQKLSTAPDHPLDVVAKKPNILSFGTIRPGKGFEEALKLAQLIKRNLSSIGKKIPQIPIVKLAGDPQDKELMQQIVVERFGSIAVENYQVGYAYDSKFTNNQRRDYWKNLVKELNQQVKEGAILNNPYIEIYPWCEAHELLALKQNCKYVCRMDDMGMRNNGSAIISVLDVGIVYTKFGSVTDDIFLKGGKYGNAVDIGKYRYGKYSLLKKEKNFIKEHAKEPLPKWLIKNPDSAYKRQPESRDPQNILDSIITREENQLACSEDIKNSDNYKTVVEAQKLLTERFTLKNAVDHLLENVGLQDLITKEEVDELFEIEELSTAQTNNLGELAEIQPPRFLSKSCPELGFFGSRHNKVEIGQENNKLKKSIMVF